GLSLLGAGPALATLGILTFLASWNNFLWPLVVASTERTYTLPVALAIWSLSALDHRRTGLPPAPLRPLLVIHLAPASLLAITASLLGLPKLASVLLGLAALYGLILLVAVRWLTASGPSPLWGGFTFPLGALAAAMLVVGGGWQWPGLGLTAVALVVIPALMWWVLQRWPGGRLAAMTNAAEA
ncbi:MAG: hypothetical protein B7Z10_02055, partial [Rhodobacterales bacterium 32-66-7]